jgi:general secretion pathway protein G
MLRRNRYAEFGFTLIEIMVVIIILGILASYVAVRLTGQTEEARRTQAIVQIEGIETALELYKLDNGTYPSTEQGLQALVEPPTTGVLPRKWREGGYLQKGKVPKDPWKNEYIYISPGLHSDFDLMSYGDDGEPGGEGKDKDVNNWEME